MKIFPQPQTKKFNRQLFCLLIGFLLSLSAYSQNVGINSTGLAPNAAAGLDVDFPNKGLLIPRVALTGTASFAPLGATHVAGMIVYNTATISDVIPGFYYDDGTKWVPGFPAGSAIGNMLYWNGTNWVLVPAGLPGQYLQVSGTNIPVWGGIITANPAITTTAATAITGISATSGASITSDGGNPILSRGICWNTATGPTIANSKLTDVSTGIGTFVGNMTGLLPITTYYVRGWAMNSTSITYGNEISFTTLPVLATVTTTAATTITGTTAVSGGNVTNIGGATITERGICYALTANPTTANTKIIDAAPGLGAFVSNLTGLTGYTTYHVRAYAINSAGTAYGADVSFITLRVPPTLVTVAATSITGATATSGGSMTWNGGGYSNYQDYGVEYSTSATFTTSTKVATSSTNGSVNIAVPIGPWVTNLTGLTSNTLYYIRSYLNLYPSGTGPWTYTYGNVLSFTTGTPTAPTVASTTAATVTSANTATSGGAITSDGGSPILAKGVVWGTSTSPILGVGNFTTDGTGTAAFSSSITGLTGSTLYYARAYATNAVGTAYGPTDVSFTTWVQAPYALGQVLSYGIVGYVAPDGTGFIVSPEIPSLNGWGCNGINVTGTSTALGTGSANTAAILACSGGTTTAASVASTYNGGGFTDWYLPSAGDWAQIAAHYFWYGLMGNKMYYTSSQYGTMYTYATAYFNTGSQAYQINLNRVPTTSDLSLMYGIRAIRSFSAAVVPTITVTDAATSITATTATSGGNITSDGGMPVTVRGVCWSTSTLPTVALATKTSDGTGTGLFVSNISGLSQNTLYYVRAYATNGVGTGYGPEITFTTNPLSTPVLTTDPISNLLDVSVTSGGNVISDGGSPVTARGVCWSTTTAPTTGNSALADVPGTGTGVFVSNITGLTPGTVYYIRAYATNSLGTAYGNEVVFSTLNLATLTTTAITNIGGTTAVSGGNITNSGGSPIFSRGVCWDITPSPILGAGNFTSDGFGPGSFVSNISGLTTSTLYYVRAYATNGSGTAFGNELSFTATGPLVPTLTTDVITAPTSTGGTSGGNITNDGGAIVTVRGVCWSLAPNATLGIGNFTSDGTGTGLFVSNITGLTAGLTYYIRAYATNSIGTGYGTNEEIYMPLGAPTVTTQPIIYTAPLTTAASGGNILSDGGTILTASGVVWSTSTGPTILSQPGGGITNDNTAIATYASTLNPLVIGTTYYVKAYATNTGGFTSYGAELSFTPSSSVPIVTTNPMVAGGLAGSLALGNLTINGEGSSALSSYGLCWSTSPNPIVTSNLGMTSNAILTPLTYPFTYNDIISGLTVGTVYHVRAYATNSTSLTGYGSDISFTATAATLGQVIPFNINQLANGVVIQVDGTGTHGLIADQLSWFPVDWGCPGISVGASGTTVGTGNANTTNILASCPLSNAALTVQNDGPAFYLPSKAEFDVLWTNRAVDVSLNMNLYSVSGTPFWSSSEVDANNAWFFDTTLPTPAWVTGPKSSLYNVWSIRSF